MSAPAPGAAAGDLAAPPVVFRQSVALLAKNFEYASPEHGDVWSFDFEPLAERFTPGQYVHFRLEEPGLEKPVRHISFASAPSEPCLRFCFHLRAQSDFKQALARLEPGAAVTLFKYKGAFTLPAEPPVGGAVLLAGGIGIAPFRSMLRELQLQGSAASWPWPALSLLHVSREGFLYEPELAALPLAQRRCGRADFAAALEQQVQARPEALYYIAGATGFVNSVRQELLALGIPGDAIRLDDFEGYDEL
ncbi:FAD-dependent oxidoreductase [bacterium]|nr:FAD-dependent oxidoreductase [bacterium]